MAVHVKISLHASMHQGAAFWVFSLKEKDYAQAKRLSNLKSETNTSGPNIVDDFSSPYLTTSNCEGKGLQKRHFSE